MQMVSMVLKSTPVELDECYALNFKIKLVFNKMALVFCFLNINLIYTCIFIEPCHHISQT